MPAKKGSTTKKKKAVKTPVEKEEEVTKKEEPTEAPKPEPSKESEKKEAPAPPPQSEDPKSTISLKKKGEEASEKNVQLSKSSAEQQVSLHKPVHPEVKKVLTIAKSQPVVAEPPKIAPTAETMIISLKSKPSEIASALLEKADTVPQAEETLPQDLQSLSEKEKVELRKKRFKLGDPNAYTTADAQELAKEHDEKVKQRLLKFGGVNVDEEREKKISRMKKFGIPVVGGIEDQLEQEKEKIRARKEKFGLVLSKEDEQKKLQRMQRFGIPVVSLEASVRPLFEQERKKKIL